MAGAFLGLLKGGKSAPKDKGKPVDDEAAGKEYSKVDPIDGGEEDEGSAEGASFTSLADALGIAPEKRARAQAALKTFVRSCGSYDDE